MGPMTAYLALTHKVADVDKYIGDYLPQVAPLLQKHGIEVLAADFGATALEGSADSIVVLRAETEGAFRDFYDDPEYAGAKALRLSITSDQHMGSRRSSHHPADHDPGRPRRRRLLSWPQRGRTLDACRHGLRVL